MFPKFRVACSLNIVLLKIYSKYSDNTEKQLKYKTSLKWTRKAYPGLFKQLPLKVLFSSDSESLLHVCQKFFFNMVSLT